MSLLWRVFLANAAILVAGTLVLALAPLTIGANIAVTEALVLAVGLVVMLAANLLLLRPLFGPLRRLALRMEDVDLLRGRHHVTAASPAEVGALERAFNDMLGRLEEERRESGVRALVAQEGERQRVARELHDEVGQTMTGVLLQLKRVTERLGPEQRAELKEAQQAVRASLAEVGRIAQELRPDMLDHLGLVSALTALASGFSRRTGIDVRRQLENDLPSLDPNVELAVYRVAQESLTNVARHAEATEVLLSLERGQGCVVLRIVDDGRGFPDELLEGGGLRGVRERALTVGGALAIKPGPAGGVEVRLEVPEE